MEKNNSTSVCSMIGFILFYTFYGTIYACYDNENLQQKIYAFEKIAVSDLSPLLQDRLSEIRSKEYVRANARNIFGHYYNDKPIWLCAICKKHYPFDDQGYDAALVHQSKAHVYEN